MESNEEIVFPPKPMNHCRAVPFKVESPQVPVAEPIEISGEYWRIFMAPTSSSIDFPIGNIIGDAPRKRIPLMALPNFHGL